MLQRAGVDGLRRLVRDFRDADTQCSGLLVASDAQLALRQPRFIRVADRLCELLRIGGLRHARRHFEERGIEPQHFELGDVHADGRRLRLLVVRLAVGRLVADRKANQARLAGLGGLDFILAAAAGRRRAGGRRAHSLGRIDVPPVGFDHQPRRIARARLRLTNDQRLDAPRFAVERRLALSHVDDRDVHVDDARRFRGGLLRGGDGRRGGDRAVRRDQVGVRALLICTVFSDRSA